MVSQVQGWKKCGVGCSERFTIPPLARPTLIEPRNQARPSVYYQYSRLAESLPYGLLAGCVIIRTKNIDQSWCQKQLVDKFSTNSPLSIITSPPLHRNSLSNNLSVVVTRKGGLKGVTLWCTVFDIAHRSRLSYSDLEPEKHRYLNRACRRCCPYVLPDAMQRLPRVLN